MGPSLALTRVRVLHARTVQHNVRFLLARSPVCSPETNFSVRAGGSGTKSYPQDSDAKVSEESYQESLLCASVWICGKLWEEHFKHLTKTHKSWILVAKNLPASITALTTYCLSS
ncbi:hypothetical protein AGOR_G00051380 [Albula goreensis]|uniref:Uncharacterized protein n=1 Tax=Albula goreensis TaxID=1534307 RepID=A0A8T3DW41_9TELE|nr:hypothetical protein AGOR_G00051380 [Albula goreensis]